MSESWVLALVNARLLPSSKWSLHSNLCTLNEKKHSRTSIYQDTSICNKSPIKLKSIVNLSH